MSLSFLEHFGRLSDHRVLGLVTYPLDEILLSTLTGLLCGAEDWEEIVMFAQAQQAWLKGFLPFASGIPSAQTYRAVFRALDSEMLASCFVSWVASLSCVIKGVVAIDGKTLRGSKQESSGKGALHLLSAYAHEAGLVIGQRAVDGKSNEITAIPELLASLALAGAIVTIDAMGTQRDVAAAIVDAEADYLLALKRNQGNLHEDVRLFFEENSGEVAWHEHNTIDAGHGRIEERRCVATDAIDWLRGRHPGWPGLTSIVQIHATRTAKKTGETTTERRYYISSLPPNAELLLAASRAHWSIENNLHWSLDVTFREDACRTRKDNAALGMATIRHAAFNILKADDAKRSIKKKQLQAALNDDYIAISERLVIL
jgi:predicted transposase YbfD/YdcC